MDLPPEGQPARKPTVVFAVCLIAAGIMLFLANLGLFPIHRVWDLWPLIFLFVGFRYLSCRRTSGRILIGLTLVASGIIATFFTTGILNVQLHDDSWWISLLMILVGVSGLAKVLDGEPWQWGDIRFRTKLARRQRKMAARQARRQGFSFEATIGPDPTSDTDPILSDHSLMGHIKRSVRSSNFEGGKITSILGNIEIDLRRAQMAEGRKSVEIELEAILGHIALRVPDTWRVIWNGDNLLGNFEDRTIPPNTGLSAPELVLTGACTMGSIEIES